MKKYILGTTLFLAGSAIGVATLVTAARFENSQPKIEEFHEHANIAVYIDGEILDLSDSKYMYFSPCSAEFAAAQSDDVIDPIEKIHLHDNDGGTIHVHKESLKYADFFEGINMELLANSFTDDEGRKYNNGGTYSLNFYLNGEEIDDLSTTEVRNLDRTLISYGPSDRTNEDINSELLSVPDNACISSGMCQHRGEAPAENCGSYQQQSWVEKLLGS